MRIRFYLPAFDHSPHREDFDPASEPVEGTVLAVWDHAPRMWDSVTLHGYTYAVDEVSYVRVPSGQSIHDVVAHVQLAETQDNHAYAGAMASVAWKRVREWNTTEGT